MSVPYSPVTRRLTAFFGLFIVLAVFAVVVYAKSKEAPTTETNPAVEHISLSNFAEKLLSDDQVLMLDIRSKTDYVGEHIPNSISIPSYELSSHLDTLDPFRDWTIVLVCNDQCPEAEKTTKTLHTAGYQEVVTLEGGFEAYKAAELTTASQASLLQDDLVSLLKGIKVPQVDVTELKTRLKDQDILLVDARTSYEFVTGFIPGAINIPLHSLSASVERGLLPRERNIIVYDRVGNLSSISVQALIDQGYSHVLSLKGGIEAWKEGGNEIKLVDSESPEFKELMPVLDLTN
ncbi:MAG: rhodanese-like domain-containing protein [Parcubacteria group bacterium]